jgi:hypothetical protein
MTGKQELRAFPIFLGSAVVGLVPALLAARGSFHDSGVLFFAIWIPATFITFFAWLGVKAEQSRGKVPKWAGWAIFAFFTSLFVLTIFYAVQGR